MRVQLVRSFALLALILPCSSLVARAQGAPPPARQLDSLIALVPPRDRAAIEQELRHAQDAEVTSAGRIAEASTLRDRAESLRKIIEDEIDILKDRVNLAKKEDREADRRSLEIERDAAELVKRLLGERESLRKAEGEVAEAGRERAQAASHAARLELELLDRRLSRDRVGTGLDALAASRQDRVLRELEGQTLDALRDLARRDRDLASKALNLVERQLKLFEAQSRLLNTGG